jgi:hypothetical protein
MTTPGNYLECVQGSELWLKLRCGYVTASRVKDAIDVTTKGKFTAARAEYRSELISERLTGIPYPRFVTRDMQWGLDHEAEARAAYELHAEELVDTTGFVIHPQVSMFGASPDGLVGNDGLIQIKCPSTKTHLDWIQTGVVPVDHVFQMLAEMSCTGREWCDFVSFDPRMPSHLQLFVRRYERDEKLIRAQDEGIADFNHEIERFMNALPAAPVVKLLDQPNDDEVQF